MALKIYNTMTRRVDEFIPGGVKKENLKDYPVVTIYSCGPTVYSYAHIGNFRTFIFNDLLRRYLKFRGFSVDHAMNITDVDDKTILRSREEGLSLRDYTEKYTEIFYEDLDTLNIERVEHNPKATDSIADMVDILENIDKKGLLYQKDGSLYFNIGEYDGYGKLSCLDAREIRSGARYDVDEYDKDDVRDFALWKASRENEPAWETPFGNGRPGWHIECSAMIRKIFKTTIDIHTGGVDLIFPHHENEIAQSEAAYGELFVRHWIHVEHLLVNGMKMSKSAGNFYTLRDLLDKNYSPRSIRYLLITAHYRKQFNFTLEGLRQSEQALDRIDNFILRLKSVKLEGSNRHFDVLVDDFLKKFIEALDNDLNISFAMGLFFEFIHTLNTMIDGDELFLSDVPKVMKILNKVDEVFGFIFFSNNEDNCDQERIENLISERIVAKANKNFQRSDEIRNILKDEGIILEDTKDGTRWKRKK